MTEANARDYCGEALAIAGRTRDGAYKTEDRRSATQYVSFGCFRMDEKGLLKENKRGDQTLFIAGPFEILGRVRDPNGEGWARLLRWSDDDKRVHTHAVSDADLHGDISALCANLASRGLRITTGPDRNYFVRYLNEVDVENRVTVVPTTGWHDIGTAKVFALPDHTIGSVAGETVIVQGATTSPFDSRGTLADWQSGVGSLVAGHSRSVFAVSAALAGPLLGLLGMEGGGFNLYGQSSRGKTTIAQAAASVWGKGDSPGFVRPWRSTANALEAAAALHADTILILDELGAVEAKEAAMAIYSLTSGTGKGRSGRDGSLRQSLRWRTMVLSTGELRLTDKLERIASALAPVNKFALSIFPPIRARASVRLTAAGYQRPETSGRPDQGCCPDFLWDRRAGVHPSPDCRRYS